MPPEPDDIEPPRARSAPERLSGRLDWTPELIARLRALWAEGLSQGEIGHRMGISKCAVAGKAHRLGLLARATPSNLTKPANPNLPRYTRPNSKREAARIAAEVLGV